jgi:hypothetical protein
MRTILAKSMEGRELHVHGNAAFQLNRPNSNPSGFSTLLIGGTHGDERATVTILENFNAAYLESEKLAEPTAIISLLNPDGFARNSRYNSRGVDLNRNFPHNWSPFSQEAPGTGPLSEPESLALYDFILRHRPAKIISIHWALAEIDADGPQSTGLAQTMWNSLTSEERQPYRLRVDGKKNLSAEANLRSSETKPYEFCFGSLGQWCGHGLAYPGQLPPAMVTLELPYHPHFHPRPQQLPDDHLDTLKRQWESNPEEYLQGVQGPVHRMLEAACRFQMQAEGHSR